MSRAGTWRPLACGYGPTSSAALARNGRKTYRVKWRLGGTPTGHPESETFADSGSALTFKLAVEAAGHRWPNNYDQGVGWIENTQSAAEDSSAVPVPCPEVRAYPLGRRRTHPA